MSNPELPAGDWRLQVYGRSRISGQDQRRRPRQAERARVLAAQGNRCLYCELPIGTQIERGTKRVILRPHWDHFVPYSYAQRNQSTNWVLACHVCNGLKPARMFTSVQAARDAILPIRLRKGYESPERVLQRLDLAQSTRVLPPTPRQLEVLRLTSQGLSTDKVIEEMGFGSRKEFRDIVTRACMRLGVDELAQAVDVAIRHGFIIGKPLGQTLPTQSRSAA